jgi:hypothetical protein
MQKPRFRNRPTRARFAEGIQADFLRYTRLDLQRSAWLLAEQHPGIIGDIPPEDIKAAEAVARERKDK